MSYLVTCKTIEDWKVWLKMETSHVAWKMTFNEYDYSLARKYMDILVDTYTSALIERVLVLMKEDK